jgi:ADP-ribose pyrophosphatase
MADERELADLPADVALSPPQPLAEGYRPYQRYRVTLTDADGTQVTQTRDILRAGKVVAVLPVDVVRDEIVLIRQFRLAAHLATGQGEMIEIVAGRVEKDEQPRDAAGRECFEEIGVAPAKLVELFAYLTTPGITDEEVIVFIAAIDAGRVPQRVANPVEGERIETLRVSIDSAVAALNDGRIHNGPLLIALQWLALNRGRLAALLSK